MKIKTLIFKSNRHWNRAVANTWKKFLKESKFNIKGTIIEIAPGKEKKIGIALSDLKFEGTIYVIEPDPLAMKEITKKYKNITTTVIENFLLKRKKEKE